MKKILLLLILTSPFYLLKAQNKKSYKVAVNYIIYDGAIR